MQLIRRDSSRQARLGGRRFPRVFVLAIGVIAAGCESERIRLIERSNAGAPNGDAGAPAAGDAGAAGSSSDDPGGATSSGGDAPTNGASGSPANEAGEGGHAVAGESGANASGGAASGGTPGVDAPGGSGAGGTPDPGNDGGSGGAPPEPKPDFPCDVRVIIEGKCQRCHQLPPRHDAPFPLLTWSDTRAEYGIQLVYEAMLRAVDTDFMPPTWLEADPPVQPLTAGEKQTMLDWLESGAPPAEEPVACE